MTQMLGRGALAAMLTASLALGGATAANAGVTNCSASGNKQETGAVVGAVVGGLLGHAVGGRHATGETIIGAGAGAAAGSAIGCEAQKTDARNGRTYTHNGYRLQQNVSPARYDRIGDTFVARDSTSLRSAPTRQSDRIGSLAAGERFQAMAGVRGSDWILVGRNGVGVGYVAGDRVQPAAYRR